VLSFQVLTGSGSWPKTAELDRQLLITASSNRIDLMMVAFSSTLLVCNAATAAHHLAHDTTGEIVAQKTCRPSVHKASLGVW
jgi:hypothetical protein